MDAEIIRSLHDEFQSFSQEELEEALQQARIEIQDELGKLNQKLFYVINNLSFLYKIFFAEYYQIFKKEKVIRRPKNPKSKSTESDFHFSIESSPRTEMESDRIDSEDEDKLSSIIENSLPLKHSTKLNQFGNKNSKNKMMNIQFQNETHGNNENEIQHKNTKRLNYSLALIQKIFNDIFTSIDVNKNYQPKDLVEQERSKRRLKDFTSRLSRMVYQTKQNYTSLKYSITKSSFSKKYVSNTEDKVAQLFVSIKNLLSSYLNFIPLSGGKLFPGILTDVLETILDIGNLAASLGFSISSLPSNVRRLEELMSSSNNRQDLVNIDILDRLARETFGEPKTVNKSKKYASKKLSSKPTVIKPRPNKIFQARTNLARMRRMETISDTDSKLTVPDGSYLSNKTSNQNDIMERSRSDKPSNAKSDLYCGKLKSEKSELTDLEVIKQRLHNLELLASTNNTEQQDFITSNPSHKNYNTDLYYLINRLEIIETDFDIISKKYNFQDTKSPFKSVFKLRLNEEQIRSRPKKEMPKITTNSKEYSSQLLKDIVDRITNEILDSDLDNIYK